MSGWRIVAVVAAAAVGMGACSAQAPSSRTEARDAGDSRIEQDVGSSVGSTVGGYDFFFEFDEVRQTEGKSRSYFTGSAQGRKGYVRSGGGGEVTFVARGAEGALAFPSPCDDRPCPSALVEVADGPELSPGAQAFSFGASVRLTESALTGGSNVLQKGAYDEEGGQWKLQIDDDSGAPSCVVRGVAYERPSEAKVESPISVADGSWHTVVCNKREAYVSIEVDGDEAARATVRVGDVSNDAAVRIGGNAVGQGGNSDQFHGVLDDAFYVLG